MKKFLECILAFLGFAGCNIIGNSEEAYGIASDFRSGTPKRDVF